MAAVGADATVSEPCRLQSSQPGANSVNKPLDDVENRKGTSTLKTLSIIAVLIGMPASGFAALAILNDAFSFHAPGDDPEGRLMNFIKLCNTINRYTPLLWLFGIPGSGSKWTWMIGCGILCPLIFASGSAHTSDHFLIFRKLIGAIVVVMQWISLPLACSRIRLCPPYFFELAWVLAPLWAGVFCLRFSEMSLWRRNLAIIAALDGVLFTLSIIVVPAGFPTQEMIRPLGTLRLPVRKYYFLIEVCLHGFSLYFASKTTATAFYSAQSDSMLEKPGYIPSLEAKLFIMTLTGMVACVFTSHVVHTVGTFLLVELDYIFNLRLEFSGANSNEGTELAYPACPLTTPDSIRVIHLHPGLPDDKLHCTLAAVRLGEEPSYEALSYCWGRHATNRYIMFRSSSPMAAESLAITDTLHDALVYLRDPHQKRTLWVDQICINQGNENERSAQVNLMQDIFSSAKCAIVWLRVGRPESPQWVVPQKSELPEFFENVERAIKLISKDNGLQSDAVVEPDTYKALSKKSLRDMTVEERAKYGLPHESDRRWTLLYGFFDAPWFRRVWIIQEVAWPRVVKVHYTNMEKSWEQFTSVMNFVESLNIQRFSPRHRAASQFFLRLRALQACRKSTQAGYLESLDEVLAQHRMAAASDPRDHIYGLMGLSSQRPILEPDYEASTRHVFLETARWAIREGRLGILGLCGDPSSPNRPSDLPHPKSQLRANDIFCEKGLPPTPSWVPDFSDTGRPHGLTGMGVLLLSELHSLTRFYAGGTSPPAPILREDDVIEILGQPVGEIQEASPCAAPGRSTLDMHILQTSTQIEAARLHRGDIIRESLRMLNTKMAWEQMARKLPAKSSKYVYTGESLQDAVLRTSLLGETGESLERLRPFYKNEQFKLSIWRLLTFGKGCSSQLVGSAIMGGMSLGLQAAGPLLRRYGFDKYFWNSGEYYARRQLSAERRLFSGTSGLIGLAPRWAHVGDQIFILRGGKVPVILRRAGDDGMYQFIGEAYVHGAMHGEMFDLEKCENILIT